MTAEAISELERHSEAECAEWQTAIGQRDEEDRHYEERQQEHLKVKDEVRAAAVAIGANSEDVDVQVNALRDWQKQRETELDEHGRRIAEWDELQQILGARTLNEVADDVEQLREDARTRVAAIDDSVVAADRAEPLSDDRLSTLETRADAARGVADTARGELIQFTANLPSAADAEDELEAAKQEHNRVKRLDSTLATTIKFLECAEERVNRNLAPVLRSTVTEWLSRVTGGRYVDCRVDPESLAVDVSGGRRPLASGQEPFARNGRASLSPVARCACKASGATRRKLPAHLRRRDCCERQRAQAGVIGDASRHQQLCASDPVYP